MKLARHLPGVSGTIAWFVLVSLAVAAAAAAGPQAPASTPPAPAPPPRRAKASDLRAAPALTLLTAWTASLPAPASATPGGDAERAYVPLRSGAIVALSLADGSVAWTVSDVDVLGSPEAGANMVFVAYPHRIEALDARSGQRRWSVETPTIGAPLFWQSGQLLAVTEEGDATMYRSDTGERLWTQSLGGTVRARPAAGNDHVYVLLDDGRVRALAASTGATAWEVKLPDRPTSIYPLDDRIFVGCADKFFYCLAAADGKTKWKWRTGGTIVGTASVDEKFVYFLSLDGVLRALDRGNGHQAWKTSLAAQPTGGPFLAARLLVVPGMSAEVAAYRAFDGKSAGAAKLTGDPAAPPHFIAPGAGETPGRVVAVTGEGKAHLLVPGLPPLRGNPFPVPYTLPPVIEGGLPEYISGT